MLACARPARRVEVAREMTIYTAGAVLEDLNAAAAQGGELELDLNGVTEIDGAGLQLLLHARRRAGERLRVTGCSAEVRETLRLSRLEGLLAPGE